MSWPFDFTQNLIHFFVILFHKQYIVSELRPGVWISQNKFIALRFIVGFFPVQPHRTNEVVSFILSWNVLRLSFGGFLLDFHLYVLLPSSQETRPRDSGHLWGLLFIICLSASSFLWRRSGFWTSFVSRYARLSLREITHGHFNVMQMYILGMIHLLKKFRFKKTNEAEWNLALFLYSIIKFQMRGNSASQGSRGPISPTPH